MERLEAFEKMLEDIKNQAEYEKEQMEKLKAEGKKNRQHTASFSGTVCFINKCWRYTENIISRIKYPLAAYSAGSEHFR